MHRLSGFTTPETCGWENESGVGASCSTVFADRYRDHRVRFHGVRSDSGRRGNAACHGDAHSHATDIALAGTYAHQSPIVDPISVSIAYGDGDVNVYGIANQHGDPDASPDAYAHRDHNTAAHGYGHGDCDPNANQNAHANGNSYHNGHQDAHAHAYRYPGGIRGRVQAR